MPKNKVTDLITDREMVYARLIQSGTMTDREAAEAAGLNPETAAYIKSKPRVRAYMLEHRAAMQAQLAQQEAEGLRKQSISREQVLARLWEIANMSPEMTRNSVTGQVKAISMIVAIEGLIPDRKEKPSASPLPKPNIYRAPWLPGQQDEAATDQPSPDLVPHQEEPAIPDPLPAAATDTPSDPEPTPSPAFNSSEFNSAHSLAPAKTNPWVPEASGFAYTPDPRTAFSIPPRKPFGRRR